MLKGSGEQQKLNMSQQSMAAATKSDWMLGCSHRGITGSDGCVIIPLRVGQVVPELLCPVLVTTLQERQKQTGDSSNEGCKDDERAGGPAP